MTTVGRRALISSARWLSRRANHSSATGPKGPIPPEALTGSAKLFADAEAEERGAAPSAAGSRKHLVETQGPVWTGDEEQADAVLRMLVDAYKPLRTGEGIKPDAADKRIHQWMKDFDAQPRVPLPPPPQAAAVFPSSGEDNPHRTKIPPHLHRPWHATYTGAEEGSAVTPKVKFGAIEKQTLSDANELFNLMELRLNPDADGTKKAKVRDGRRTVRLQGRLDRAREGAIDYRLGIPDGALTNVGSENADGTSFSGNRQVRGASVLGGGKGRASGLRAWGGLVEDRIQVGMHVRHRSDWQAAKEAGFFEKVKGKGKPIVNDPEMRNPHLELGEVFMNRIVKRQGALPPWIELQQELDKTLASFRNLLFETYTKHLVRTVLSTNGLSPLPPLHAIPGRDEAWEARETKFHDENVRQINNLVRKMNAQAPNPARRHLISREGELDRIRGDTLRSAVWSEVQKRAQEIRDLEANGPPQRSFLDRLNDNGVVSRLGDKLGSTGSAGGGAGGGGGGASSSSNGTMSAGSEGGGGIGLLVLTGIGLGAVVFLRKPKTQNDSPDTTHLIPVHEDESPPTGGFVASSPSEPSYGILFYIRLYVIEPISTILRFLHLALLFGPVILTAPMIFVGSTPRRKMGKPVAEPADNWGAVWWYGFLVKQMERAGPSFIKLGQWAASRADLFPAVLCQKMSKLHSSNNPHSFRYTKRTIEKAFGMALNEIFEEFDETPIGCGAIAQVYRAKLRPEILMSSAADAEKLTEELQSQPDSDSDERIVTSVAIKVLHPRVDKLVKRDIAIMSLFANILNALPGMEWLSLPEEVQAFGGMMNQQLDLRVEGANLEKFEKNFAKRGKVVTFPKPIKLGRRRVAAAKNVLVEEYEDALPLKYFLRNGGGPYDELIANIGLDAFLEMLLLDNWTHGDLHPGNIMVRFVKPDTGHIIGPLLEKMKGHHPPPPSPIPLESVSEVEIVHDLTALAPDKTKWLDALDHLHDEGYIPQLVFIDAGLVTSLDETNRRDFLDLFQAVAEFDGYKAGKLMVERCKRPDLAIDEETFALKMQHLVLSVKSKTFSLANIKISDILTDVLTAVRQHHVKLEGDFVNTVISILLLEGIGRQLDPDMDLFRSALPILRQLGRQMGTREAISHVQTGNIWAMAKLWIWAEARSVAGEWNAIDRWIKYDLLSPNI